MLNVKEKVITLSDGRKITIETGKLAKQAHGSVVVKMGDTMLLATVVSNKEANNSVDYLPLSVDYQEKYASAGRFPGGFFKREARPSEYEILIARLVDRALRPLFPKDYHADTQVLVYLMSSEEGIAPDALAGLAASSALMVSDIPFNGPMAEVRVAKIGDEYKINPLISELENASLELIVAGTEKNILMVEGEMKEVPETDILEAIRIAHTSIQDLCRAQLELRAMVNEDFPVREYSHEINDEDLAADVRQATYDKLYEAAKLQVADKHQRSANFKAIREEYCEKYNEEELAEKLNLIKKYFHDVEKDAIRNFVLTERKRLDGRDLDEIRPIWCEIDYLPSTHGSAVFTRGETQSLTSITLGTKMDEQIIDGAVFEGKNKFLLHYNFPPYSTGEAKFLRGTSRREVGHGNLAMRALKPMLPQGEDSKYTIRVVSDILESNGSSSMATVCAGSLALMDAGIPLKKPVSGIAMGMISDSETGKYAILSDILGDEDHLGDMDFKVTGTIDGVTACQMDIKVDGLSFEVLAEALEQARKGRHHILGVMNEVISEPREDYKPHVPRIEKIIIPKDFIGAVIGPGGKIIQQMQKETETTISIEEVGEEGHIEVASANKASIEKAKAWIAGITAVPEAGTVYNGTVKNIVAFGAFIEILPGKEGLLHISEIDWARVEKVEDVLKTGQKIEVKLLEVDRSGKLKLSRKALLPRPERDTRKKED